MNLSSIGLSLIIDNRNVARAQLKQVNFLTNNNFIQQYEFKKNTYMRIMFKNYIDIGIKSKGKFFSQKLKGRTGIRQRSKRITQLTIDICTMYLFNDNE